MPMGKSRVTAKYQITLPADVRARAPVRPGVVVEIEARDDRSVIVRRVRKVANTRSITGSVGSRGSRNVTPSRVDEMAES